MYVGLELLGSVADAGFASRVIPLHPLRLVEKEHADPCRPDHVFDHALAAVLIGLVLQPVGLVDDEHLVQAVFHEVRRVKTPRRLEERLAVFAVVTTATGELLDERVAERLVGSDEEAESLGPQHLREEPHGDH
jgi:hypothetical protein